MRLSNIIFTPISYKHSQFNLSAPTRYSLFFSFLLEENTLLELLIIITSSFISSIFSSTYSIFLTLLSAIAPPKTALVKVSSDCQIAKSSDQCSDLVLHDLSAAFDTINLFFSLVSRVNPPWSLLMVRILLLDLLTSENPRPQQSLVTRPSSGSLAQKTSGFSPVIFDSSLNSLPHIQSNKNSYWLCL